MGRSDGPTLRISRRAADRVHNQSRLAPEVLKRVPPRADVEGVHSFAFSRASGVADRPPPVRRRRRRRLGVAISLLVIAARLLFVFHSSAVFHPLPDPSCASGVEPPEAREGICARFSGSGIVIFNVVDHNRVLHMPEYDARLLAYRITPTSVTNWRLHPEMYPEGHGTLASFELEVSNPGAVPLQFGPLMLRAAASSYLPDPTAELLLPTKRGSADTIGYPVIYNGRGAPSPSIFGRPPIQPHTSLVGWVTTVAPPDADALMAVPRADLDLLPTDGNPDYVGQIRLWK